MHADDIAAARQLESKQSKPQEVICGKPKLRAVGGMIGWPHQDIAEGPSRYNLCTLVPSGLRPSCSASLLGPRLSGPTAP